ncbi:hypothetical protein YC2023_023391 [Brassica napus]
MDRTWTVVGVGGSPRVPSSGIDPWGRGIQIQELLNYMLLVRTGEKRNYNLLIGTVHEPISEIKVSTIYNVYKLRNRELNQTVYVSNLKRHMVIELAKGIPTTTYAK